LSLQTMLQPNQKRNGSGGPREWSGHLKYQEEMATSSIFI